jgi:hypothetical protein
VDLATVPHGTDSIRAAAHVAPHRWHVGVDADTSTPARQDIQQVAAVVLGWPERARKV